MPMYTAKYLEDKLSEKLSAQYVSAVDESDGCGSKFSVVVVAAAFRDKTKLQRHRLVHSFLTEELRDIHAFSQKSYTPEEWEKAQQQKE